MVRTKEKAGASSSKGKGKQPEQQPKKRRYLGRDNDSDDSDEEEVMELDPADKPKWEAGLLDDQPEEWQPTLFNDRMNRLKDKAAAFICVKERKNLKIEAKLLLTICILNVIPRRGDKQEVRFPETPILYSSLHGSPRFSFRYLVMNHVWICRNKVVRSIIPYCRIITGLLKLFKSITPEDKGAPKRHRPFDIRRMGVGWSYDESERYHKLKSEGQRWRALKVDARALLPGEVDEPKSEDEPPSGDEDYADEPHGEHMNVDQGGSSR
ncbi:hypothetical protein HanIR_Chr04g0175491 [Helianthus annuus]|nr:hypothetical protein HanIR_Chr04g0175491 [Helianthus annuus]